MDNNKTVIITGASSGIGLGLAQVFYEQGWQVVMMARNLDKLTAAAAFGTDKSRLLLISADVTSVEDCERVVRATLEKFHHIHVLVNNAGISMRSMFSKLSLSVFERVMAVNFYGTVYMTYAALPHLLKEKGSIIGISSTAGRIGLPARTAYSASKFAMEGFLTALATENKVYGLHVLMAFPGFTASNIRFNALKEDGTTQGFSPQDEAGIMQPISVARGVYRALIKKEKYLVLGFKEKLAFYLSKFLPSFVANQTYVTMSKEPGSPLPKLSQKRNDLA